MTLEEALKRIEELEADKRKIKSIALKWYGEKEALRYKLSRELRKHEKATKKLAEYLG